MVVNYELTAADFREAAAHHQQSAIRRKLFQRMQRGSVGGMLVFSVVVPLYFLVRQFVPVMESPERAASPVTRAADMLLPLFAVSVLFVPIQTLATGVRAMNWSAVLRTAFSVVCFAITAGLVYLGATASARRGTTVPQPLTAVLAPHLSWLLLTVAVVLLAIRSRRQSTRVAWEGQQHLHLPFTLDASVAGLTFVTPNGRHEYPWRGVTAFLETPNLFLVHVSDLAFQIVPKRAFASDEERDAFRNMLRNLTSSAKPAFEVVPAGGQASS